MAILTFTLQFLCFPLINCKIAIIAIFFFFLRTEMHIFEVDKPSSHAWPPPRSPQPNLTQPLQSPLPPTQPRNLNTLGLDTASDYAPRP